MAIDAAPTDPPLTLIGLCAQWCGVCREFEPGFAAVAASMARAGRLQAHWLDVEEGAISDALGDVEVETFPTIAIGRGEVLLFWGDILPHQSVLERLVADAVHLDAPTVSLPDSHRQAWRQLQRVIGG